MVRVRPHPAQLALAVVASGAEGQTGRGGELQVASTKHAAETCREICSMFWGLSVVWGGSIMSERGDGVRSARPAVVGGVQASIPGLALAGSRGCSAL